MRRSTTLAVLTICAGLAVPAAVHAQPARHVVVPTAQGTGGAVATVDKAATDAAIRVLRQGGNAVDAAVTAAGVLGVVEPYSCGIGGGGFLVIRTPGGKVTTIDGRETAPLAMRPDSFIENGKPLGFTDARWSGLSAGVPGTPADVGLRAQEVRHLAAAPRAAARDPRGARGLRDRRDVLRLHERPHSPTSTTSRPRRRCISIRTGRRATSARSSAAPTWPRRTS